MKSLFSFSFFWLMSLSMIAQDSISYKLHRNISEMFVSPDSTSLCISFADADKKKDESLQVGLFNLQKHELVYHSPILQKKEKEGIQILDKGILLSSQGSLSLIDWNGHDVWKEYDFRGFLYKKEADIILLLRETGTGFDVELDAISMSTGEKLWSELMDYDFITSLRSVHQFSKSTILVLAQKIHKFGRKKGLLAEHTYSTSPQGANHPVVVSDDKVYLAEWKKLTCFDKNLDVVWSVKHPAMAKNDLKDEGNTLKLINYGYIKTNSPLFPVSHLNKPYIARYDKKSGEQLSINYLSWEKRNGLISRICSDTLLYVKKGDAFQQLQVPEDEYVAVCDNGDVYSLDGNLQIKEKYADHDVYYRLFTVGDKVCIGRKCPDGRDFYMLASDGRTISHFPDGTSNVLHVGQYLYYSVADTLYLSSLN